MVELIDADAVDRLIRAETANQIAVAESIQLGTVRGRAGHKAQRVADPIAADGFEYLRVEHVHALRHVERRFITRPTVDDDFLKQLTLGARGRGSRDRPRTAEGGHGARPD